MHWLQTLMFTSIDSKRWWLLALTSNVAGYLHCLLMLILAFTYLHWLQTLMVTCIDFKCWCYLHCKRWWLLALTSNVDVTCTSKVDGYLHWFHIDCKCWWLLALTSDADVTCIASNVDVTCTDFKHWCLLPLTANVDGYLHWLQTLLVTCIAF